MVLLTNATRKINLQKAENNLGFVFEKTSLTGDVFYFIIIVKFNKIVLL